MQHDIFLQSNYLKALEIGVPNNIQLYYVGVFQDEILVGIAVIQRVQLYLEDIFRKTEVSCLKELFKSMVSKVLKGNILVVGNLTHTGQHALFFDSDKISSTAYFQEIFKALETLKKTIKQNQGKTIRLVMLKDFFCDNETHDFSKVFQPYGLHQVFVQPNMVMPLPLHWTKIEDYISDLSKKYRDRFKRARRKLGHIKRIELDLKAIELQTKELHGLYLNVSNNAKFNTFILPENHFYNLKLNLQEQFKVFGYYLDGELVGFYTLLLNNQSLETYFLGYNSEHQHAKQLYLNMLYDMLTFGIEHQFTSIVYARTAMAIKSSVGAKPESMKIYMKHTNGIMNALLNPIFKLMNPKQDWEERHPFKI